MSAEKHAAGSLVGTILEGMYRIGGPPPTLMKESVNKWRVD
jgi:hypothetical protein